MKTFTIFLLLGLLMPNSFAQTIDETNGNITGFNRIITGNWLDIQLLETGNSFKIHDSSNGNNWVKWTAGTNYTEFIKDLQINANILGIGSRTITGFSTIQTSTGGNIEGYNRIKTGIGSWLDIQLIGADSRFAVLDQTNGNYWVKWTAGTNYTEFLNDVVLSSGSLGIGTIETGTHKLAVHGTIGAREIKVEAGAWSDFVFNDEYELKDLVEVESFIKENNHLPDIPSEKEVLENGIKLGEMDAKLLQKIEELTLYMIELNKGMKALSIENSELKNKIEKLEEK